MKDFDFENIDKRIPYQAPDGFFENACQETLNLAKKKQKAATLRAFRIAASAAVAAAIIVFAGLFMLNTNNGAVKSDIALVTADSITILQKKHIATDSASFINDIIEELSDQDLEDIISSNAEIDILYAGL